MDACFYIRKTAEEQMYRHFDIICNTAGWFTIRDLQVRNDLSSAKVSLVAMSLCALIRVIQLHCVCGLTSWWISHGFGKHSNNKVLLPICMCICTYIFRGSLVRMRASNSLIQRDLADASIIYLNVPNGGIKVVNVVDSAVLM